MARQYDIVVVLAPILGCLLISACERAADDVPGIYKYDIANLKAASEASGDWSESKVVPLPLRDPRAIACAANGRLLAAGDRAVIALEADGRLAWRSLLSDEPRCLGPGKDGRIYVGCKDHIVVLDDKGGSIGEWTSLGENAVITSIAAGKDRVWVADAGARKISMFDQGGRLLGYLSPPDPFVVPSPFFDVAADGSEGVWVVNPGCLRVEHYAGDGRHIGNWGKASMVPAGFAGCCNPIHIALLPDGRFATSEKGIARIKSYAADGTFESVVAGPSMFAEDTHGLDLATTDSGDILVLDKEKRSVRQFGRKVGPKP